MLVSLTSETVQGTSLTFQSIDDIHGGDSLALSVFSVCDGITNDVFQENLQDATSFFVDETADTFHTTATGQTTNCGLGNSLDVITKNFAMTFGSTFA